MNWIIWLVLATAVAVLLGSAFVAGQSPRFWWDMGLLVWEHLKPGLLAALAKDFTPERAKEVADAARQGRDPDWRGKHGHAGEK